MEFMRAGFDVLCSDLDVMWLGDPRPWVRGLVATSELMPLSDVIVSTDVTHGGADRDEAAWGINYEMVARRGARTHATSMSAHPPLTRTSSALAAPEHGDGAAALDGGRDGLLSPVEGAHGEGGGQGGQALLVDGPMVRGHRSQPQP